MRNLELFRRYALEPNATTAEHRAVVGGVLLLVLGVAVAFGWVVFAILRWLDSIVIAAF